MATALDSSYTGVGNVQNIPVEQRIYGRTKEIVKITKGRLPMMRVMTENMGPKQSVTDFHFKYKSDYPLQAQITIGATSSNAPEGGTDNIIWVPTVEASRIREGARLFVDRIYYNGNAGGTGAFVTGSGDDYLPASATNSQRECIKVLEKRQVSGTNTAFKVERGYLPAGTNSSSGRSYSAGGGGTPEDITTSMTLIMSLVPQAIGDNTGIIYGDTPHEEENYCEIALEKMGVARSAERVQMYQTQTILQRNSERQIDVFWKKNEWKCLFGRKNDGANNPSPVDGAYIYETNGLDNYIRTPQSAIGHSPLPSADTDGSKSVINFKSAHGAVNYQNLNDFGKNKFYYGSTTKWWIHDDIQGMKIANCFDNKVRITYNNGLSLKYGFKVNDLEISGGGTFHLVQSDLFSIQGLRNWGYIVDFDYFRPVNLQGEDFTIMVDVEKGLNPLKRVDYLYMNRGYHITCPQAHFIVYNL